MYFLPTLMIPPLYGYPQDERISTDWVSNAKSCFWLWPRSRGAVLSRWPGWWQHRRSSCRGHSSTSRSMSHLPPWLLAVLCGLGLHPEWASVLDWRCLLIELCLQESTEIWLNCILLKSWFQCCKTSSIFLPWLLSSRRFFFSLRERSSE